MLLLTVTADTWIVTGLGFGIVLLLLFFLVFILQGFGWIMQRATAPKAPKAEKAAQSDPIVEKTPTAPSTPSPQVPASVADDTAAIAMALYLASRNVRHDVPTSMISLHKHETAWNEKSIGLNNIGF